MSTLGNAVAREFVAESNPICTMPARMEGVLVAATDSALSATVARPLLFFKRQEIRMEHT